MCETRDPYTAEDGLYIGTYSNFFTDPDQIKGVVIFCAFLASFLSLGRGCFLCILFSLFCASSLFRPHTVNKHAGVSTRACDALFLTLLNLY